MLKGYLVLAIVIVASTLWCADGALGQTPQQVQTGASQPPASGQATTPPGQIQSPAGQPKTTPTPANQSTVPPLPQRPSDADVAAAASTATSLTGGGQTSTP